MKNHIIAIIALVIIALSACSTSTDPVTSPTKKETINGEWFNKKDTNKVNRYVCSLFNNDSIYFETILMDSICAEQVLKGKITNEMYDKSLIFVNFKNFASTSKDSNIIINGTASGTINLSTTNSMTLSLAYTDTTLPAKLKVFTFEYVK